MDSTKIINEYLKKDTDTNAASGGGGAGNYQYVPSYKFELTQLTIYLECTGSITESNFGDVAALTTGFDVEILKSDDTRKKLIDTAIKATSQFSIIGDPQPQIGGATRLSVVCFYPTRFGAPITLNAGEKFNVKINDSIAITTLNFVVSGILNP